MKDARKDILHICPKVVYTFGDCEKSPFFLVITDLGELQFQYVRGCNDALY
jgi:hypothetical protein